ncbi:dihydrofolate reductase family protein [Sunxiuqinia sp. A32]|uniref:dihydrofolate reductase family protein n=1 Tax=Sunxiuqinia sp. A32 TaxID=3461496 RepID=UPI0040466E14
MRKVILYIATSLDNCIAKPDGNIDWLNLPQFQIPGEDFGFGDFYQNIDTILMGHETYKVITGFDIPYPHADRMNYVFSRTIDREVNEYTRFVSKNVSDFVRNLKGQKGKDIWLVGGGQINTLLLQNELIDQIILTILPITLGDGIPLFQKHSTEHFFHLEETKTFKNGMVQLVLNLNKTTS